MTKRGEVWIRGSNAEGTKWGPIDILDLDDESFRAWVVDMFIRAGGLFTLRVDAENIEYRAKEGVIVD